MDHAQYKKIKLSIIIVDCGTPELTLHCIRSIYEFKPACPFEVVLVNNGSNGIEEEPLKEFLGLKMIKTGSNVGFSKANNLGIHNARGDFIVLLNNDTLLIDQSFDRMLAYMEQEQNRHVGVLGPREVDGEERFRLSCGSFPTFFSELNRKIWHYRLTINDYNFRDHLDAKHASMKNVDWVSGSCMMLRRTALQDAGLLDEGFFLYFEDIDLCRRFWEKKWEVHYFPETSVIHYGGGSARKNLMLAMTEYRRSEIYFARKYYGRLGEFAIRFFLFLKYGLYFTKQYPIFLARKLLKKKFRESYVAALLSKKVVEITCSSLSSKPLEPPF